MQTEGVKYSSLPLSSCQGYPSVRHSLLRMHSQLRSASGHRRETSAAGPIDLSRYVSTETGNKVSTRSASSNTTSTSSSATPLRPVPIITSLVPTTTHTIYSSAVPSSSSSSSTAMSTNLHGQSVKSSFVSKNFVIVIVVCFSFIQIKNPHRSIKLSNTSCPHRHRPHDLPHRNLPMPTRTSKRIYNAHCVSIVCAILGHCPVNTSSAVRV